MMLRYNTIEHFRHGTASMGLVSLSFYCLENS